MQEHAATPPRTTECELHISADANGQLTVSLFERRDDGAERRLWRIDADHRVTLSAQQLAVARQARENPRALTPPTQAASREFAALLAWMWQELLPPAATAYLARDRGPHPLRVVLRLQASASELPWEALADANASFGRQVRDGTIELVRRPAADAAAPAGKATDLPLRRPPVRRKAVLLIGSTHQDLGVPDAMDEAVAAVTALQAAGFEVVTISGSPRIQGRVLPTTDGSIHVGEVLVAPPDTPAAERNAALQAQVARLLTDHRPAVVHVFGHAGDAEVGGGARSLQLDAGGFPFPLPIALLASALRESGARVAVFSACHTREHVAHELIAAAGIEHVIAQSALVTPAEAQAWCWGFYGGLGTEAEPQRSLPAAFAKGREALRAHAPHAAWLPQHWASPEAALTFVGADQGLIEDYCEAVVRSIEDFEGRFAFRRWRLGGSLRDVYVELGVRDGDGKVELDERDDPAEFQRQPSFAHLVDLHTRRILLGGDPGAGKSTTLRMFAHDLARDALRDAVPVFVRLASWAGADGGPPPLLEFVVHELAREDWTEPQRRELRRVLSELGREGRLVFLLDGLDELQSAARTALEKRLQSLPPRCKVVVSTRRYQHTGSLRGFFDANLAPLTPDRAAELLEKLLRRHDATRARAGELAHTWRDHFTRGARLWQELHRVPLFVTLIAELLMSGKAPTASRAAFFDEVLQNLILNQHRGEHAVEPLRLEAGSAPLVVPDARLAGATQAKDTQRRVRAVLDVLGHVATAMTKALVVEATRTQLVAWIQAAGSTVEAALQALDFDEHGFVDAVAAHTGLLGPEGTPSDPTAKWRFWHRSFQEALTAWDLARAIDAGASVEQVLQPASAAPDAEHVQLAEQDLRDMFARDDEALWDPLNELLTVGTEEDRTDVWRHNDGTAWLAEPTKQVVAKRLAPYRARQVQQDFWIEPAIALVARMAEGWLRGATRQATAGGLTAGVDSLVSSLLARDPTLGRRVVARLDHASVVLLATALESTSWSDARVQETKDSVDLWLGMTNRLRDREPLYAAAPRLVTDAARLAQLLAQRAATVDDAGELFLIAWAASRIRDPRARADAEAAVAARLDRHPPDPGPWRGHFVALPGGTYRRGSEQGDTRERPVHDVTVAPFALGRTPIPVALWRQFWPEHRMAYGEQVATLAAFGDRAVDDGHRFGDLPVTQVSWFAARMFCLWLQHHRQRLGEVLGERWPNLPTEAQAEYAIRGGESEEWWFGAEDQADEHAWFEASEDGRPRAVGTKRANGFGLHDVVGNVWWWCLDAYDPRAYAAVGPCPAVEPGVPGSSASSRVVRGGSFADPVHYLRSANRDWHHPAVADWDLGVRVALVAAPSELGSGIDLRSLGMC